MRALHLVKTSTGAEWALRQMRELVELGVDVHVAVPEGGPTVPAYKEAGVVVHPHQFDFPLTSIRTLPRISRALRALVGRVQPDILHSHFVGTTLTMRVALGRSHPTPRVFQVPGPLHLEHAFYRRAELLTAGRADYWVGSCQWTCERYRRSGIASRRVFLSYYGTDLARFTPGPRGTLRQALGLTADTRIVGMVAFMYAPKRLLGHTRGLKGHEDLIDAMALCIRKEPRLVCVFVGGAWNHATDYENRVRAYGRRRLGDRAVFLGTRPDVLDLYRDIDVAVHPSISENLGGAVESLLMGVPTIATNVGGFPDVVRHGETGWLVPPRSPARLAEVILDALDNPEQSRAMASRGRVRVCELADIRKNAREIADIYQTILQCHG